MHDWMKVVRSPIRYRVGDKRLSFKLNPKLLKMGLSFTFLMCIIYMILSTSNRNPDEPNFDIPKTNYLINSYNDTYPLSKPSVDRIARTITYEITAIADLDTSSKMPDKPKYVSYLLKGKLVINQNLDEAKIDFDDHPKELSTQYAYGDRGMELSELVTFNGKLYSCDDRTGIIYQINTHKNLVVPWVILVDGDGKSTDKGFKCEWMTVKDHSLYVGGLGKEWTTAKGELVNHNPQWVKKVTHYGDVTHLDWKESYNKIREPGGYLFPGYMIFESCVWNSIEKKWYFLPRRASREAYDEELDEHRATNLMIKADENFDNVVYKTIGEIVPVRGYSSFKFVPDTNNKIIIALKSEEDSGKTRTYVTLFNIDGTILVNDKLISDKYKYEGVEFV